MNEIMSQKIAQLIDIEEKVKVEVANVQAKVQTLASEYKEKIEKLAAEHKAMVKSLEAEFELVVGKIREPLNQLAEQQTSLEREIFGAGSGQSLTTLQLFHVISRVIEMHSASRDASCTESSEKMAMNGEIING